MNMEEETRLDPPPMKPKEGADAEDPDATALWSPDAEPDSSESANPALAATPTPPAAPAEDIEATALWTPGAGPSSVTAANAALNEARARPPEPADNTETTALWTPGTGPSTLRVEQTSDERSAASSKGTASTLRKSLNNLSTNQSFTIALLAILIVGLVGWLLLRRIEVAPGTRTDPPTFMVPSDNWEIIIAPTPVGGVPATRGRARWANERPFSFPDNAPAPRTPYGRIAWEAGRQHGIDPRFLAAVMTVESAFNAGARSHKGALGLMQIMPATGRIYGASRSDLLEPGNNIDIGARHLKMLADLYDGDPALVLAAYNAGETAVARYGGIPPYAETQDYVRKVRRSLGQLPRHPPSSSTSSVAGGL